MAETADESVAGTVTWLHVSDFHFRAPDPTRGERDHRPDQVFEALLRDVERRKDWCGHGGPLDLILVTGDVAFSGQRGEYDEARRQLARLGEAAGVSAERVFCVPGNHDIDRGRNLSARMRHAIQDREAFEEVWGGHRQPWVDKFAAYTAFATSFNQALVIPPQQPGGFYHTVDVRGCKVALLGLCSAWLGGDDQDKDRLIVGEEQAYALLGGAEQLARLKQAHLRLALMHHPLDWLQRFDRKETGLLLQKSFDVLLHGHLHEAGLVRTEEPGRGLCTIAAGSAYAGRDYPNAYNLVRASLGEERTLEVWLREYSSRAQEFDKDVHTYHGSDGHWVWKLETAEAPPPAAARGPADLSPLLRRLRDEHRYLDVRGIGGGHDAHRMELKTVYTRLRVDAAPDDAAAKMGRGKGGSDMEPQRGRTRELAEVLADPDNRNLVLVGDPGSGKTTFLRFVALNLARAWLDDDRDASLARIGLTGEPPFPVFVSLALFGQYLMRHADADIAGDAPGHFYRFLSFSLREQGLGVPEDTLQRAVRDRGGCMLLLDGLDEVPGRDRREQVGRIIEKVVSAGERVGNRHLVTSRTRAYRGKARLDDRFRRADLVEFGDEEIAAFVDNWSRALFRVEHDGAAKPAADRYAADLLQTIDAHPAVRPMTGNPLMLTVLAVVHWNQKKLPEQRAELYERAVDYLLESRSKQTDVPKQVRLECMQAIASAMFSDDEVRRTLGRREAAEAVHGLLGRDVDRAVRFIEDEELHSGLLVSRTAGEVEFWHLTFQEFLAAKRLAFQDDYFERIAPHLYEDRWNELVLLLAGCRRSGGVRFAQAMIHQILGQERSRTGQARAVGLVGRILRDLKPAGGKPQAGTGYDKALEKTLACFRPGRGKPLEESVRVEVGEALGQAGDPRLVDFASLWVPIPAGKFWMGAQDQSKRKRGYDELAYDVESPVHQVDVPSFELMRFPTTVAQFRGFVDAGKDGYLRAEHWAKDGWAWREREGHVAPGQWKEQVRHPNRPVVYVSWYEARAYCAWLTATLGSEVRLPSEAEWEYAARGTGNRRFPWGDDVPTTAHCNYGQGSVNSPTPVGVYPLGATPEGVQDLSGNVLEWCQDAWQGNYDGAPSDGSPRQSPGAPDRVIRGGGWDDQAQGCRAAFRSWVGPVGRGDDLGFRLARS